jgi:nicotinate phosphoribosyltransferase
MAGDTLALSDSEHSGEPLLRLVMRNGRRVQPSPSLDAIRAHVKRELERLPEPLRRLEPNTTYAVEVADELQRLAAEVDRRMQAHEPGSGPRSSPRSGP